MAQHLLEVNHLQTVFHTGALVRAVDDVSFYLDEGEIISIVGESGSGKSVSMQSILQLIQMPPGEIIGGEALFEGQDLLKMKPDSEEIRKVRGGKISMIFQEPMTSLNPVLTVGEQIRETIMLHLGYDKAKAHQRAIELLNMVGIPDSDMRVNYYPTQFSGGMRQRIMIAMTMASDPKIIIADEATTALDVTTQEQILELLRDIVKKTGVSLIIITHNLSVVARYAERIYVMYSGNVVEQGTTEELFAQPSHPYTIGLLNAIPRLDGDRNRKLKAIDGVPLNPAHKDGHCPFRLRCCYAMDCCEKSDVPEMRFLTETHGCACYCDVASFHREEVETQNESAEKVCNEVLLEVRDLCKYFPVYKGLGRTKVADVKALDNVSFKIYRGETLGLVGESGCGKTTLAKTILRIYNPTSGEIRLAGKDITSTRGRELRRLRRNIQFIFQDPFGSLNPRQTAENIIGEPIRNYKLAGSKEEFDRMVDSLCVSVGLDPEMKHRYPHLFSGGQRQRISIARSLASNPEFVICDEPISALDVSIQAQIINLLIQLQKERNLTYLFIAHDLSVVRHISDRILVMYMGKVVEISKADALYENPMHPYTQALLSAVPIPDPVVEKKRTRTRIEGELPSLINRPTGCVFHSRCPYASEKCKTEEPELLEYKDGHSCACWHVEVQKNVAVKE